MASLSERRIGRRWTALLALAFAAALLLTRQCPAFTTAGCAPARDCCSRCCPLARSAKTSHPAPAPPCGYCCAAAESMLAEGLPTLETRPSIGSGHLPTGPGSGSFAIFADFSPARRDPGRTGQLRRPFAQPSCLRVLLVRCHPGNAPPGGFCATA